MHVLMYTYRFMLWTYYALCTKARYLKICMLHLCELSNHFQCRSLLYNNALGVLTDWL